MLTQKTGSKAILFGLSRRMGKAKRAHLYPVMGTGACPLPILRDY